MGQLTVSKLQVFLLDPKATVPTRNLATDAGTDIYSLGDVFIPVGATVLVKTGVAIRVLEGHVGLLRERSSIGKKGLKVAGGVIDASYTGDISILLMNFSNTEHPHGNERGYLVKAGDRIAQILIVPVDIAPIQVVDTLWTSERGSKGLGSSGK